MKILLLTHAYNCLCQKLHIELLQMGHSLSIEFDINDCVCIDAVQRFAPDLIIAPFLKRAIPEQVWRNTLCWIVHPGIVGDRGPSSLDWAILNQEKQWGVTILQANEMMDGGDIWASASFPMRRASKSSIYRQEVTLAATTAIRQALCHYEDKLFQPTPQHLLDAPTKGQWRGLMKQSDRAIDWLQDCSELIARKIDCADGNPGLLTAFLDARLQGQQFYLFNASIASNTSIALSSVDPQLFGQPGCIVAQKNGAIAVASRDGTIWITHLRKKPSAEHPKTLKLPATLVLAEQLPKLTLSEAAQGYKEIWQEIQTDECQGDIGYLYFNFHNGAISTEQCQRLLAAYNHLAGTNVCAIVLMGGSDFWCNGIHLNMIEASSSPADESWRNINALNDFCQAIIETTDKLTVAAINTNIAAGGLFMALACDLLVANEEVVLNPHYKAMGNLFGSEYWTYLLPKRVGQEKTEEIMQNRLPLSATQAKHLGLVDLTVSKNLFLAELSNAIKKITEQNFSDFIKRKQQQRQQDESEKPLQQYRDQELGQIKLNFYGFDASYHVARYHFVFKSAKSHTPSYLAKHRAAGYLTNSAASGK
jgi:putative two-component system hydrogenase maturation factor HypX/HoxX